jgi:hypothetical protein
VPLTIRPYENGDARACCQLWIDHYSNVGLPSNLTPQLWEFAIVSKIFFDRDLLLLAIDDQTPVGFIHVTLAIDDDQTAASTAIINALCVKQCEASDAIASELIATMLQRVQTRRISMIKALGSPEYFSEYLLIAPIYGMLGVHAADHRLQRWLATAGFRAERPLDHWEVGLSNLRSPMDRGQMAVRRNSSVGRVLNDENESWFLANAYGHAEQMRFTLSTRGDDKIAQEIVFFYLDQSPMQANLTAQVVLQAIPVDPLGMDQMTYLLAESLRQLQYERFGSVIAITQADDQTAVGLLRRLSFRTIGSGVVYSL